MRYGFPFPVTQRLLSDWSHLNARVLAPGKDQIDSCNHTKWDETVLVDQCRS